MISFTYDSTFNRPTKIEKPSLVESDSNKAFYMTYNDKGNVEKLIETGWTDESTQYSDTSTFTYNSNGQLLKSDGPRTDVVDTIHYDYYSNGDLKEIILPNGDKTEFGQRNNLGQQTWYRAPNGDTTRYEFDVRGKITKLILLAGTSDSAVTEYTYNVSNDITSVKYPEGGSLAFDYDSSGYLIEVTDENDNYISMVYDSMGNVVSEVIYNSEDTLKFQQDYSHSAKHQIEWSIDANDDSTGFTYLSNGNLDRILNAIEKSTFYRFDEFRRLTNQVDPLGSDSIKTQYFYDKNGNLNKVIDPDGFNYVYNYDDKNRLVYDSSAVTGVRKYSYDAANNLTSFTNAADSTYEYAYDALSRLTNINYPDSNNVSYVYDGTEFSYGKSRLYQESAPSCTTRYQYDSQGRIYKEFNKIGSEDTSFVTTYDYDLNDNLTTIIYPSGNLVKYDYDSLDNVITVRVNIMDKWDTLATDISYSPFGEAISWTLGNGIEVTNDYDLRYLIEEIKADTNIIDTLTTNIVDRDYTISEVSNITKIIDGLDTLDNQYYSYDDSKRIDAATGWNYPDTLRQYFLSYNGNLDSMYIGTREELKVLKFSSNRLDTIIYGSDTTTFSYDNQGNITSKTVNSTTTTFQYNDAGQLVSIDNDTTASYYYDARNRRVQKDVGESGSLFINSASGQVLTELDYEYCLQGDYVYLNGKPLAKLRWGVMGSVPIECASGSGQQRILPPPSRKIIYDDILYYINDHLGTPLALTDYRRYVLWSAKWYPYGEIYDETTSETSELRFPGQWEDDEDDLVYNWHRYYDPEIGRYYQADPIGLAGGINPYGYVGANPNMNIDPHGLDWYESSWGDLYWFDRVNKPTVQRFNVNYKHYAGILYDEYNKQEIDPNSKRVNRRIPIFDIQFGQIQNEAYNETSIFRFFNYSIRTAVLIDLAQVKYNLKERNDLICGQYDYVRYKNRVLTGADLGNILFGQYGRHLGFPLPILKAGGGIASSWENGLNILYWNSYFDDPRGHLYLIEGYNNYYDYLR